MLPCQPLICAYPRCIPVACSTIKCLSALVAPSARRRLSTSADVRAGDTCEMRFERPQMYQLEHIQKRLECTTSLMFRSRLDYTFYRNDIVLHDKIFNQERIGRDNLQRYFGLLGLMGKFCFPHIEMQPLNISAFLDDGTVRLRWRVVYLNMLKALDPRNLKLENRLRKVKWYDGYSIFYVDGEGLVYKLTLQRVMPDDSDEKSKAKKLAEKIAVLPGATNFVVHKALSDSSSFSSSKSRRYIDETISRTE